MVANFNSFTNPTTDDNDATHERFVERLTLKTAREHYRKVNRTQQRWQRYLLRRALRRRPYFVEQ